MAFPILLILAAGAAGAYMLMTPSKKPGESGSPQPGGALPPNPVVVPPSSLPVPPGGVPSDQMPGGPPTVIVTPPSGTAASSQTPQQVITQSLPQVLQNLPQLVAQASQPTSAQPPQVIKEVPSPGQSTSTVPATAVQVPASTPQQVLTQALPTAVTQILNQALPQVVPATPLQTAETHPDIDTYGTIALAKLLIDREATANWKSANQAEVLAWQKRVGLTADGKFGEKGELRMAQEVGVLPLIRYWPANTLQGTEVPKYATQLRAYAASIQAANPAHAAALSNAAAFEVGQSYAANPAPIPISLRQGQADLLSQILKQ